jgi:hypothetical protein
MLYRLGKQYSPISAIASLYYLFDTIGIYTDWTNNIVQYQLSPHCTICLIPSAFTPESIRDKIYKILAYYINHIGINYNYTSFKKYHFSVKCQHFPKKILLFVEFCLILPWKEADKILPNLISSSTNLFHQH